MLNEMIDDWEFNHLGVFNYKNCEPNHHLRLYHDFISENHDAIEGDLAEIGVFKGSSLLATAMFLRDIGSGKKVYGFDSFSGFPPVFHENDDARKFEALLKSGRISERHFHAVQKRIKQLEVQKTAAIESGRITSVSGNFENNSREILERKIDFLGLTNVVLVQGAFHETMGGKSAFPEERRFMAAWLDCDIYSSYQIALPFIWKRLSHGGYIHLDEYYSLKYPGGRMAIDEFFSDKKDRPKMHRLRPMDFERWYVNKIH